MAKKKEYKSEELKLTSMMDVTFQLIIFFILISNFAAAELPQIKPPKFDHSVAWEANLEKRLVVSITFDENILSSDPEHPMVKDVTVGIQKFQPFDAGGEPIKDVLVEMQTMIEAEREKREAGLTEEQKEDPETAVQVVLRADGRVNYRGVAMVMEVITRAGIKRANLIAERED